MNGAGFQKPLGFALKFSESFSISLSGLTQHRAACLHRVCSVSESHFKNCCRRCGTATCCDRFRRHIFHPTTDIKSKTNKVILKNLAVQWATPGRTSSTGKAVKAIYKIALCHHLIFSNFFFFFCFRLRSGGFGEQPQLRSHAVSPHPPALQPALQTRGHAVAAKQPR